MSCNYLAQWVGCSNWIAEAEMKAKHCAKKPSWSACLSASAVFLVTFLLAVGLHGQIGASGITGTVSDPTGAAVPNAKVTVKNEATGVEWRTVSSATGAYTVRDLPPGTYTVMVEAAGFQKNSTVHVGAEVEKVSTVDVALRVGTSEQEVNVTATPATALTTESGTVSTLIPPKEITTLPLNGRSWISLNYLAPGAVNFHGTTANESVMASVTPPNVVLNGLRGGNNSYYLDGSSLQVRETQVVLVIPPLDAINEFRVQTADFSAEYLGGAAGVISAATKSGSNQLHGAVWEYLRNSALDAKSYFDTTVAPLKRNQFGAVIGGPIIKSKTFFFGGYEGFRQSEGQTLVTDLPTAAERSGNLSDVSTPIIDPYTGQPYTDNQVPVNPLSKQWLDDWIPLPNTNVPVGQGNYRIAAPAPIVYDSYIARIDHNFSDKTNIFGRFLGTWDHSQTPWYIPGFLRPVENHGINVAVQAVHTFNPTTVGQLNLSWNRPYQDETIANSKNANMLTELGLVPGAYGFTTSDFSAQGPPRVTVTGFGSFGSSLFGRPRRFYGNDYHLDALVFLTRGSHSMKFGGNLWREFYNFPETINPTGAWSYNGFFSGNAFADFLLALPRSISAIASPFYQDLWRWQTGLWFQDDWKVTPKLTVNLGLRWDVDDRWLAHSGRVANLDLSTPPTATLIFPVADAPGCPSGGCSPVTPPGWNKTLTDTPKYLWSPRLGAAYRIGQNTVVRGGAGIYWQPLTTDPFLNLSLNPPFVQSIAATYDTTTLSTFDRTNPLLNTTAAAIAAEALQHHIKDAYISEWNLTVEHLIGANLFTVGYIGNKGTQLYSFSSPNLAPPGPGPIQPRRPYTNFGGISFEESGTDSNYNALQAKMERRFSNGLAYTASYAYSKCIDTSDGTYIESQSDTYQRPNDRAAERAVCEFDVRHALTFTYIYELPIGRGKSLLGGVSGVADKLISGWQIQGLTSMFSGDHRLIVTNSWDNLNNGGTGYPDLVCDPNMGSGRSNAQKVAMFFNTSCFAAPGGGTVGVPNYIYGDSSRHPLDSPGIMNWDLALQKDTMASEKVRVQFSAEAFNVFNRVNFAPPNASFGTPQFGTITSADPGREIQFGLKVLF
jgi:Carboxypeptidase regulatory-like domain/TonB dependent receptor-like, beta-barrel